MYKDFDLIPNGVVALHHRSISSVSSNVEQLDSDSGLPSDEEIEKRKTSVTNPNYEWLQQLKKVERHQPEYENLTAETTKINCGDDDIFTSADRGQCLRTDMERTYSEPDSGVDVGVGSITFQKIKRKKNEKDQLTFI